MFPEKFTFEYLKHRTAVSDSYDCIYKIIRKLEPKKGAKSFGKDFAPSRVDDGVRPSQPQ